MAALTFGRENKQDFVCLSLTRAAPGRPGSDCLCCPLSPQPLEVNNPTLEQRVSTRSPSLGLVPWQPSCPTAAGLARAGLRPAGCHLPQFSPCSAAAFFFSFWKNGSTSYFKSWLWLSPGNPHLLCWWEEVDEILDFC